MYQLTRPVSLLATISETQVASVDTMGTSGFQLMQQLTVARQHFSGGIGVVDIKAGGSTYTGLSRDPLALEAVAVDEVCALTLAKRLRQALVTASTQF